MGEIKRMFTPEFRNRLDAIVSFAALDEEVILRVVDKFLMQLEAQLAEKKVEAMFTETLKKYLAKNGFDPQMGARPMARLIQDTIRRGAGRRAAVRQARQRRPRHDRPGRSGPGEARHRAVRAAASRAGGIGLTAGCAKRIETPASRRAFCLRGMALRYPWCRGRT